MCLGIGSSCDEKDRYLYTWQQEMKLARVSAPNTVDRIRDPVHAKLVTPSTFICATAAVGQPSPEAPIHEEIE